LVLIAQRSGNFDHAIEYAREAVTLSPASEKASLVFFHVVWREGLRIQALDEMESGLGDEEDAVTP
jgi:hypothetical protein